MTQLLSTFHDFAKSRNSSVASDVVFLGLAKAFDSVPHERLLIKLYSLGIESKLLTVKPGQAFPSLTISFVDSRIHS